MQARRSSLYRKVEEAGGPVTYFHDDFSSGTVGDIAGQDASHVGSWISAPASPYFLDKRLATTSYVTTFENTNQAMVYAELVPGPGLSFDHDKLRIIGERGLLDLLSIINNNANLFIYTTPGQWKRGLRVWWHNTTTAAGIRFRIGHYSSTGSYTEVYASGQTLLSDQQTSFEIVVERLAGDIARVKLTDGGVLHYDEQFSVGSHIASQSSILAGVATKSTYGDAVLYAPLIIDSGDS